MDTNCGMLMTDGPETEVHQAPPISKQRFRAGNREFAKAPSKKGQSHRRIGPARWARARIMFIQGELASQGEVATWLNCSPQTVQKRSLVESWQAQRKEWTAKVTAKLDDISGLLRIQPRQEQEEELAGIRAGVARLVLGFAKPLADSLTTMNGLMDLALALPPSQLAEDKLATLAKLRSATLDDLCRLAGLPEPGRASAKPAQASAQTQSPVDPASFGPVGVVEENKEGGGGAV